MTVILMRFCNRSKKEISIFSIRNSGRGIIAFVPDRYTRAILEINAICISPLIYDG